MLLLRLALLACFFATLLLACGGDEIPQAQTEQEQIEPAASAVPMLPQELMQKLVDSVDYIDFVYYTYEFSMSMDNQRGIQYTLAMIGEEPAQRSATCKPIGRIFFQIAGRNAASAQLYFTEGCTYLEFLEDEQLAYANNISDVGKDFLNNQFSQLVQDYQAID